MEDSVFTKIIKGELPAHKIYEDDKTIAFLDIHPARPGHTLIVPKVQVDRLEDLSDEDYRALMESLKKVMRRLKDIFGDNYRICLKVEGFDVPHVHVQAIPCEKPQDFYSRQDMSSEPDHDVLSQMAHRLKFD